MAYDLSTYTGLVEAIQAYTECDETSFVANIPNFVQNTERTIYNLTSLPVSRFVEDITAEVGNPYVDLPTDFISAFSLSVIDAYGGYTYLLNKDVNYIRECFPTVNFNGIPKVYALFNDVSLLLAPTPDAAYSLTLEYMGYPESLVTADTTWLSTNYPNALLWGSLVEAYVFQKGEADIIQGYQGKFQEIMQLLKQVGDGKNRQDNYRTAQFRQPVQ